MRIFGVCGLSTLVLCLAAFPGGATAPVTATVVGGAVTAAASAGDSMAGDAAAGDPPAGGMDPQSIAAFRCSQLNDPLACMSALSRRPDDPGLLVAEADALMSRGRPGEAIGVYRHALRAGADRRSTASRIADAESSRKVMVHACNGGSDAGAEADCEAAWLPGAPDEVHLFKRRGRLSRAAGRLPEALQAYLTAARLAPTDHEAALALVELTEKPAFTDAPTLMARGKALLILGRPADAIVALRQAKGSGVNPVDAERELKRAERAVSSIALQQKTAVAVAKSRAAVLPAAAVAPAVAVAPAATVAPTDAVPVPAAHPSVVHAVARADKAPVASEPPSSNEAPATRSN